MHDVKSINSVGNNAIVIVDMVDYIELIVLSHSEAHVLIIGIIIRFLGGNLKQDALKAVFLQVALAKSVLLWQNEQRLWWCGER